LDNFILYTIGDFGEFLENFLTKMAEITVKRSGKICRIQNKFFKQVQNLAEEGQVAEYIESSVTPHGYYGGFKVQNMHEFLQLIYPDVPYASALSKFRSKISPAGIRSFDENFTCYASKFEPFNKNYKFQNINSAKKSKKKYEEMKIKKETKEEKDEKEEKEVKEEKEEKEPKKEQKKGTKKRTNISKKIKETR